MPGERLLRKAVFVNPYIRPPLPPMKGVVVVDLVMGYASLILGALLIVFSGPLATHMREGDDGWRERGWTQAYEPDAPFLATDRGRWWIFRGWLLLSAAGFVVIGIGLVVRGLLL
jgi:hypothetical protein